LWDGNRREERGGIGGVFGKEKARVGGGGWLCCKTGCRKEGDDRKGKKKTKVF